MLLKLFSGLFMTLPHIVQYCSTWTYCTMSYISWLMQASPPLSHCFSRALSVLRTAVARRFLAPLLPMPALASSSARSFLITAHSCFASRSPVSFISIFDHCVSTRVPCGQLQTLRHTYSKNPRYYALQALFGESFRLIWLKNEMTSDRWLVEEMIQRD